MDAYIDAIEHRRYPVTMLSHVPDNSAVNALVKAAFDRGVLAQTKLDAIAGAGTFDALVPLFNAWQKNGLVYLEQIEAKHAYVKLTLAGEFWAVTLAQNLIQILQSPISQSQDSQNPDLQGQVLQNGFYTKKAAKVAV